MKSIFTTMTQRANLNTISKLASLTKPNMSFTTGMILSKQCHIEMPQTILQENVYRNTCINKHVVSLPLSFVVSSVFGMA